MTGIEYRGDRLIIDDPHDIDELALIEATRSVFDGDVLVLNLDRTQGTPSIFDRCPDTVILSAHMQDLPDIVESAHGSGKTGRSRLGRGSSSSSR